MDVTQHQGHSLALQTKRGQAPQKDTYVDLSMIERHFFMKITYNKELSNLIVNQFNLIEPYMLNYSYLL